MPIRIPDTQKRYDDLTKIVPNIFTNVHSGHEDLTTVDAHSAHEMSTRFQRNSFKIGINTSINNTTNTSLPF